MTAVNGRTGIALGGTFVAILIGITYLTGESAHVVASIAGFATAITLIAAAAISWERVVVTAESAGIVERSR